mmetsp:Transcript_21518/g.31259  ORF Transcript_21518/g.31259 Transcript_21518/m.31259 type:complete len:673 (+) Transcript_21518:37-2055(+)
MHTHSTDISIGSRLIPRMISLDNLIELVLCDPVFNYDLLMPVLLFLPSFSTPVIFLSKLIDAYKKHCSSVSCQMNILIILRCWLRETFAHADLGTEQTSEKLSVFLTEEVISCGTAVLSAAGLKVKEQLDILVEERDNIEVCLKRYVEDLARANSDGNDVRGSYDSRVALVLSSTAESVSDDSRFSAAVVETSSTGHCAAAVEKANYNEHMTSEHSLATVRLSEAASRRKSESSAVGPPPTKCATSTAPPPPEVSPRSRTRTLSVSTAAAVDHSFRPPSDHSDGTSRGRDITKQFSYRELADMLTVVELEDGILTLRPRELVCMRWTQAALKPVHPDLGGCAHLNRLIQSTNQRIAWIADEIIHRGTLEGSISACIEYFLRAARHALKLNNFNTVFQIMSALNLPAIKHLSSAWSGVSAHKKSLFEEYSALCDPADNYANYRKSFRAVRGQARIPCIQVLLRDIVLLETSSPWVEDGQIDISKMERLFRLLNLNVFSANSSSLIPTYSVYVSKGSMSPKLFSHDSSVSALFSGERDMRGFCVSCLVLQESLFLPIRQQTSEANIRLHENSFGSYARIGGDLISAEDMNPPSSSSFSLLSLFSHSNSNGRSSENISSNSSIFTLTVSDDNLSMLLNAINRTNTDLNVLWQNSKVADDIENTRLMHRLMRAGLA